MPPRNVIIFCFQIWFILICGSFHAQDSLSLGKSWEINPELSFYLIPDDFFVLPVVRADKNKLHLEARYNYEDRQTFSGWVGYNIMGGKTFEFNITPMLGGAVGSSNGIAPGIEITLLYHDFELYSENESFIDLNERENDFIYTWTDFTYSPTDWLWVGLSAQRTRLYQTDLDIQRGVIVGGGNERLEITGYVYNLFFDDLFMLLTLSAYF